MRQPLAITPILLEDLVQYQKSKDKGVAMAARGLQSLYRDVYPELLQRKHRGKKASMELRSGQARQLRFAEEKPGKIEGLELLEQYKMERNKSLDEDEWEIASDETTDDEYGDWINVSDEEVEPSPKRRKPSVESDEQTLSQSVEPLSTLATTSVLTPADFAKLNELRTNAQINGTLSKRRRQPLKSSHADDAVTALDIEAAGRLNKATTKEERLARAKEGKPELHKSNTAQWKEKKGSQGKSTTNQEKARKKNFMMTLGQGKRKQKRSLTEVKKSLRGHVERQGRGGNRRNGAS